MADAAIGGKTAVNTYFGKNLIGSFYQPISIFCDIFTLKTLSKDDLLNGLVEILRNGLTFDKSFFFFLNTLFDKFNLYNKIPDQDLEYIVFKSCQLKADIVKQDEYDHNIRHLVNFGHTIGHAIEVLKNYTVSHGQAVLEGLWVESCLSNLLNLLPDDDLEIIQNSIQKLQFSKPVKISIQQISELKSHMLLDKKSINKKYRFVLLKKIGKPYIKNNQYSFHVDEHMLDRALNLWIKNRLSN